jgi:ribonuclease E
MLIDAAHAEETRVVVMDGSRIEEFDFESKNRKQLRGNIYLAKVTRVEPSLQAAFIEYGGNRHGFLAFNEIHPDYFQIPVADREALMREVAEEDEEEEKPARGRGRGKGRGRAKPAAVESDEGEVLEAAEDAEPSESAEDEPAGDEGEAPEPVTASASDDDDDMEEEVERRRRRLMRKYKIQDVIRRRQIMLVQVVKEERGNKGAALTTYLSLAGRYCVLMPNTDRGGGISRKIESTTDRKRLKGVVQSLDVPKGLGLIVRTAGAKRTKAEIKRDYEYLMRLWENIRETTLGSVAPALIYEEEDLVKRAIRDLFDKDIESIQVEGEAGYREARDFMRMIMPSQSKKVSAYREPTPLFVAHRIEGQLSQIYSPVVPLRSGGYLVINQTEALVAIDVNSGKATRERNIEATALKTNLEAAEEACRQLRLRDLAGLIVIDFIDMEESKNNRAVEKVVKDCLKDDRARVQMGRISSFGLMEISRQRRRTGVLEGTTHTCPHCEGTGRVRAVEMEALKGGGEVTLKAPAAVALYILNEKRAHLARIHQIHHLYVTLQVDDALAHADYEIERTATGEHSLHALDEISAAQAFIPTVDDDDDFVMPEDEEDEDEDEIIAEDEAEGEARPARARDDDGDRGGRNRRRRRRGGRRDEAEGEEAREAAPRPAAEDEDDDDRDGRRRRRGRRGGRRSREEDRPRDGFAWARPRVPFGDDPFQWHDPANLEGGGVLLVKEADNRPPRPEPVAAPAPQAPEPEPAPVVQAAAPASEASSDEIWVELPADEPVKKPARSRSRGRKKTDAAPAESEAAPVEAVAEAPAPEPAPEPQPEPEPEPVVVEAAPEPAPEPEPAAPAAPVEPDPTLITSPPEKPKRGWWRR